MPNPDPDSESATDRGSGVLVDLAMIEGLPAREVDRRLRLAFRVTDVGKRARAFYAYDTVARSTYKQLGYGSLNAYARALGISRETFDRCARTGERLALLPVLDSRFAAGTLCWSTVYEASLVATPETDAAWAEALDGLSSRQARALVKAHGHGELPKKDKRGAICTPRIAFTARLVPDEQRVIEAVRVAYSEREGRTLSDHDLLMLVFEERVDPLSGVGEGAPAEERAAHRAAVHLEAQAIARKLLDPANAVPFVSQAERDATTPKAMRLEVLARDGNRCRVCQSKHTLSVHHVVQRARGGPTVPGNLVTLCRGCHSLVHVGYLVLRGTADDFEALDDRGWRIGTRPPLVQPVLAPIRRAEPGAVPDALPDPFGGWLTQLPPNLSHEEWRRVRHLVTWDRTRGGFLFAPGYARSAEPGAPAESAEPAASADSAEAEEEQVDLTHSELLAGVGHPRVRAQLATALDACSRSGEPLGHTLLTGPAGVGKSSLAAALAADRGTRLLRVMAAAIKDAELLVRQLCALEPGDVLFVDELHGLPSSVVELLYDAMERGELHVPVAGEGWTQTSTRVGIAPFTLIGATTDPDKVPAPLLSRFVYRESLEFYDAAALAQVVRDEALARGFEIDEDAAQILARAAHDTPRDALRLLRVALDGVRVGERRRVDIEDARQTLVRVGRDPSGLDALGRRCLLALREAGGCLGLRTLATKLGVSPGEVVREIEPHLIRRGWIEVTRRGRRLVPAAEGSPPWER